MKKVIKWLIAQNTDACVWRVTYVDGKITRLLSKREATPLSKIFTGKIWIDYEKGYF